MLDPNETPIQTTRRLIANPEVLVDSLTWRKLAGALADDAERYIRLRDAVHIPDELRKTIVLIWSEAQIDAVLDAGQVSFGGRSAREMLAAGNFAAVREWLGQIEGGAYT